MKIVKLKRKNNIADMYEVILTTKEEKEGFNFEKFFKTLEEIIKETL
jgi:hypothetical protein